MHIAIHSIIALLLQTTLPSVAASPVTQPRQVRRDEDNAVHLGEHADNRTIVVILCIVFTFAIALAQGYRAGRTTGQKSVTKFSDMLVLAQCFVSISCILSVGVKSAGLGLSTDAQCHAAIRVCIAMYGAAKMLLYLFLLERVHIVREPFVGRFRDPLYIVGTVLSVSGFIAITGYQYISPEAQLSRADGLCRIGIEAGASVAIIVLDTTINLALTAIFAWQLRPAIKPDVPRNFWGMESAREEQRRPTLHAILEWNAATPSSRHASSRNDVQVMIIRNVIGSTLSLAGTLAVNITFLTCPAARLSHVCSLTCMADVVLSMLVTNWLTMGSLVSSQASSRPSDMPSPYHVGLPGASDMASRRNTAANLVPKEPFTLWVDEKPTPIKSIYCGSQENDIHFTLR